MQIRTDYVEYWFARLNNFDDESRTTLSNFDSELETRDFARNTREAYLGALFKLLDTLNIPLAQITKDHMVLFLKKLHTQNLKRSTRMNYYNKIVQFFKWYKPKLDLKIDFPRGTKEVEIKKDWEDKLPTIEEIELMLKASDHPRDRAFLSIIVESGARINEVLRMQYGDVKINDVFLRITLRGRTKTRDIPLIWATKHMLLWLEHHPTKQSNAPLWTLQQGEGYLSYKGAYGLIRRLAQKASITRKIHPHLYRHLRATLFAKDPRLSPEMKKMYLGYSKSSRIYESTYIHPSQEDLISSVLQSQGLLENQKTEYIDELKTEICPRCGNATTKNDKFCSKCWLILDAEEALKHEEEREKNKLIQLKIINLLQELCKDQNKDLTDLIKLVDPQQ